MLLGPIKALYSIKFYLDSLKKSSWKAVFFLFYVFIITVLITSVLSVFYMRPKVYAAVDTIVDYMPEMTITNGVMKVNNNMPLKITPEELNGYNILFDTGRTEPVYPTEMKNDKTLVIVGPKKLYFSYEDRFQENELPSDINANITKETLNASKEPIASMAMGAVLLFLFAAQIFRFPFMLLLAFLVTLIIGKTMRASTKPGDNFKIASYIQAPALLVYLISYFTAIPGIITGLAYIAVFIIYGQIIFNAKKAEGLPAQPEQKANDTENN